MPFDLASAEDVKCLLQDAMPSNVIIPTTSKLPTTAMTTSPGGRIDGAAAIVATVPSQSASKAADQVKMSTLALYLRCSTLIGSWPYPQTLGYAGKACQG
jgi:hypothetical protein